MSYEPQTRSRRRTTRAQPLAGSNYVPTTAAPVMILATPEPPLPEPYNTFGQRAAALVMTKVARFPPKQRTANIKQALFQIEPALYNNAQKLTKKYIARGMAPNVAAFHGLARAMGNGLAAEVIAAGKKRKIKPQSMLGLGAQALGASGLVPV